MDPVRISLVDMNNGVPNEAIRCFRRILASFTARVRAANPRLTLQLDHVQPRNLGELPSHHVDLFLSSGGPGSPHEGWDQRWCTGYRTFLDWMMDASVHRPDCPPAGFLVCHSFEIAVQHFQFATMEHRGDLKFAIFPAYVTTEGRRTGYLAPFEDRLFIWEHRHWQAVAMDEERVASQGGALLATESRPGRADKGHGLLGFRFGPGLDGTQFHPEADRPGVLAWIDRPEHASALKDRYGHSLYDRMMRTLSDPARLARTYALLLPGWLTERFNRIAAVRGLHPIPPPVQSMEEFEERASLAS